VLNVADVTGVVNDVELSKVVDVTQLANEVELEKEVKVVKVRVSGVTLNPLVPLYISVVEGALRRRMWQRTLRLLRWVRWWT